MARTAAITVLDFVGVYQRERDLKADTVKQLECVARAFERFAGRVPLADVTDDLANRWLIDLQSSDLARLLASPLSPAGQSGGAARRQQ